jgi:hypothetical protein
MLMLMLMLPVAWNDYEREFIQPQTQFGTPKRLECPEQKIRFAAINQSINRSNAMSAMQCNECS